MTHNDNLKIKALMVYFDYWGVEEARERRREEGYNKTISALMECFVAKDQKKLLKEVRGMTEWNDPWKSPEDRKYFCHFWHRVIDLLLDTIGGDMDLQLSFPTSRYDNFRFAKRLGISAIYVYQLKLDRERKFAIDALLALPVLK